MGFHLNEAWGLHPAATEMRVERSKVLASNLANETTPGYQARDFDFQTALRAATSGEASPDLLYRVPNQPSRDGNTVELGVEQAAFAQNAADFEMGLTFMNATFRGLSMAINGNANG